MDSGKYVIRHATDADLTVLSGMYAAFLEEVLAEDAGIERNPQLRTDLAVARLMSAEQGRMLVAEADGQVAAFAYVEIRGSNARSAGLWGRLRDILTRRRATLPVIVPVRGWFGHLYVAPAHRRRGIATSLVLAAADWARDRGAKSFELNVLASNAPARRLYEKLGMTARLVDYRMKL